MGLGLEVWKDRGENGPYKMVGGSQGGTSLASTGHCKLRLGQVVKHALFCQGFLVTRPK